MSKPVYEKNTKLGYKLEVERLKEKVKEWQDIATRINEYNNQLLYIIKEAREYIENAIKTGNCTEDISYENGIKKEHNYYVNSKDILEILDKVGEE